MMRCFQDTTKYAPDTVLQYVRLAAFLLVGISVLAPPAVLAQKPICGLNVLSSTDPSDFITMCWHKGNQFSPLQYTNEMIQIVNLWVPPLRDRDNDPQYKYCSPPIMFNTQYGENAAIGMGDYQSGALIAQRAWLWLDDRWLSGIVNSSGSTWVRVTLLAHEFGHVLLGHVRGLGATTLWQREYDADVFAGRTLARLGAPLQDAQALMYFVSQNASTEQPDAHPSLAFRLQAISEGFASEQGASYTRKRAQEPRIVLHNASRYQITVMLEEHSYDLAPQAMRTITLARPHSVLRLWNCPPEGCRWTDIRVVENGRYRVVETGRGAALSIVAQHSH